MQLETLNLIKEIIGQKDLSSFINMKEDLLFEAKESRAYNLDSPDGRYELTKDVSALANVNGGYLIIGLKTDPLIEENTDKIVGLDLINKNNFQGSKYVGILNEYIYPRIHDLEVNFIIDNNSHNMGIISIYVPAQDENKKFFLIKNLREENSHIKQIVFGIAQRVGSANVPLTIEQLHQKIQRGKSSLAEKLTRLEEKIDFIIEDSPHFTTITSIAELDKRIDKIKSN